MTVNRPVTALILLAITGCCLLGGRSAAQDAPDLPQQMGTINDYAASLGRQTRDQLQSQIDRLRTDANVNVAVLISLIDPFSDPARYAEAIWDEWELGDARTVLLVYVREGGERWAFRVRASSDVSNRLSALRLGEARTSIDSALADRDVAEAVRIGVGALAERWAPETPSPSNAADETPTSTSETDDAPSSTVTASGGEGPPWWRSLWAWIGGGILVGLAVLGGVVWTLLTWFCPRCGARLRKREASVMPWQRAVRGRGRRSVYYCPRCRYERRPQRRRPQGRRRTRGERRRAAGRRD